MPFRETLLTRLIPRLPRSWRRRAALALRERQKAAPTQRHWVPAKQVGRDGIVYLEDGGPPYAGVIELATIAPREQPQESQALLVHRLATALNTADMEFGWAAESRPGGVQEWTRHRREALQQGQIAPELEDLARKKLAHVRSAAAQGQLRETALYLCVRATSRSEALRKRRRLATAFTQQGYAATELDQERAAGVFTRGLRFSRFAAQPGFRYRYGEDYGPQALEIDAAGRSHDRTTERDPRVTVEPVAAGTFLEWRS